MRRFLVPLCAILACAGLLAPSADADTTPAVLYDGLPAGWQNGTIDCTSQASVPLDATNVYGPVEAMPPSGHGSLRVSEANGVSGGIEADFSQTEPALSTLSAFDAYLYAPSSGGVPAALLIEAHDPTTNDDYELGVALAAPDQWTHLDAATATLFWNSWDHSGALVASGNDTLQSFLANASHANVKIEQLVVAGSCDPGSYYLDLLNYSVGATAGAFDFEGPTPSAIVGFNRSETVASGQAVTLGARLTHASLGTAGETVQLWAKSAGSTTYHLVASPTTDSTGAVSYRVAPSSTTTYQWRYVPVAEHVQPATSQAVTLTTHQIVALTSKPTTVAYRGTLLVKGRVTPHRSGVTVRLVRIVSGRESVIATSRTTTGGYFAVKVLATVRGTGVYAVVAAAYLGENAGQSATFKVVTR